MLNMLQVTVRLACINYSELKYDAQVVFKLVTKGGGSQRFEVLCEFFNSSQKRLLTKKLERVPIYEQLSLVSMPKLVQEVKFIWQLQPYRSTLHVAHPGIRTFHDSCINTYGTLGKGPCEERIPVYLQLCHL